MPRASSLIFTAFLLGTTGLAPHLASAADPAAAPPVTPAPLVSAADSVAAAELVASGRRHAAAERHGAAVRDFLTALSHDIRLVGTIAEQIAYQRLWREDANRAIFYFRRHLIRNPDGQNRAVRKGLALALSWNGRQDEALQLYRQLVAEDPDDGGARIGLGRTLTWDNRLRSGFKTLREVEKTFPGDSQAGRESSLFLLKVLDEYTPHLELRAEGSRDSDDQRIARFTASGTCEVGSSILLQATPAWTRYRQTGLGTVVGWRFGLGLLAPLAHNWAVHAYGWYDRFASDDPVAPDGSDRLRWDQPGGDLWLTWLPAARLRTDFGGSVMPVETVQALGRKIHARRASASLDWRLVRPWTLSLAAENAAYSDHNRRRYGSARLTWRREGRVDISLAPVFTYLGFNNHYPGSGYWSPGWMRNGSLEAVVRTHGRRWTLRLTGRVGREQEQDSDPITVGSYTARLGWRCGAGLLLAVEGGHSRSRLADTGGYSRDFLNLSLRAFF